MREGAAIHKGSSEIRVLHVDDEPVICDVTKLSLERWGEIKVDVVHSGPEALEVLKNSSYACVISDYEMPLMNGIELFKKDTSI